VGGQEKFQKQNQKKETGSGAGEKIEFQKRKLRLGLTRAEKGQTKKCEPGMHRDRKESASSIHIGARVGAGSICPQ
jgi:hypothetical protein